LLNRTLSDHIQRDDVAQIYCWFFHLHNAHKKKEDEHDDDDDDDEDEDDDYKITRVLFCFLLLKANYTFLVYLSIGFFVAFNLLINSNLSLLARNFSY